MSEGSLDVQERETPALADSKKEGLEAKVRELEDYLQGAKEQEVQRDEARVVLREREDWSEWGWGNDEKEAVKKGLLKLFEWDTLQGKFEIKKANAHATNAMELLLAEGKTASEVLNNLRTLSDPSADGYREVRTKIRNEAVEQARREPDQNVAKWEHHYYLKYLAKEDVPQAEQVEGETFKYGLERNDVSIRRFVLSEEFEGDNKSDFDRNTPRGLEELGWQAGFEKETEFGVNGRYPILQMELKKVGDKMEGRYHVNQANFLRWMRQKIMFYEDKTDDELNNYFNAVKIEKEYRPITLDTITDERERYFTDGDGNVQKELYNQMLKEVLQLLYIRQYDLEYKTVMSSGDELTKKMSQMYYKNKITKNSFGKSSMYYMSTIPLDYKGDKSDDKLGAAFSTFHLAYYNLADFDKLQEVLGKDSSFFTERGMLDAIGKVVSSKHKSSGNTRDEAMAFLGPDAEKNFKKAFKDGKADKEGFTKFINYFGGLAFSKNLEKVVQEGLKGAIMEQFNFKSGQQNTKALDGEGDKAIVDEASLEMAWLMAFSWLRFSGAATRNDTGYSAFDATRKLTGTEGYRRKMATEKRGNAFGNMYTVPMFKKLMLDFMQGVRVSEASTAVIDGEGKEVIDQKTKKTLMRKKAVLEVFEDMNREKLTDAKERKRLEDQLEKVKDKPEEYARIQKKLDDSYEASKRVAGQLEFNELAMVDYHANHVARAQKVYDQVMNAKELPFDKFSKYDPLSRSVSFDRAEFQKEVQEDFLKPLRYLFDTYGQVNYNMPIREQVFLGRDENGTDQYEFREMMVGEALFGHQMLDIPEFRLCQKNAAGEDIKGKYVIDKNGRHKIDYTKVQKDSTLIFKQWAMMKLGADLWTHIDRHSKDPNYNIGYFKNVLDAIESIPGEVTGNEFDMRGVAVTKKFFSKEQLKWFKNLSKTTNFSLFWRGLWNDTKHRSEGGFSDSFSIFLNAVFRGY